MASGTGAKVVEGDAIYSADADLFAPCALGGIINDQTIPILKVEIVAGGANNQLLEERHEEDHGRLFRRHIAQRRLLFARAVAPSMKKAATGRIVTISSRAGLSTSLTGIQAYASAKHGQVGLVKQLAQELGPFGITVNSVAPGFMATSPDYQRQWNSYSEEFRRSFPERIAMRRMGRPEDIADAVLFFASDHASWITGQTLPVTGSPLA